jgi:hypothetical protein
VSQNFYVAVTKNGRPEQTPGNVLPVAGPFSSLEEAECWYQPAKHLVLTHYNPGGQAHWYGYAIIGLETYNAPGYLNEALGIGKEPEIRQLEMFQE